MGEQSNTSHKVEAKTPALRKKRAPNRARGASGATGYLLSPEMGEEGVVWSVCGFRLLPDARLLELWLRKDGARVSMTWEKSRVRSKRGETQL
jgi:hypothetical protein